MVCNVISSLIICPTSLLSDQQSSQWALPGRSRPVNTITLLAGPFMIWKLLITFSQLSPPPQTTLNICTKYLYIHNTHTVILLASQPGRIAECWMLILIGTISNSNQSKLIHWFIYLSISQPIRWSNGRDLAIFIFCLCGGTRGGV